MVTGENGILTRSQSAVEKNRAAAIQEEIELAITENEMRKYDEGTALTKDQIISNLATSGKLTDEEVATLETSDTITIGGVEIDFSTIDSSETETTLTFTIGDSSYQFEEGMNWAQWVSSSYNTAGYRIDGDTTGKGVVVRSDSTDEVKYIPMKTAFNGGSITFDKLYATGVINSGENYTISNVTLPTYWYLSSEGEYTSASGESDLVTALSNGVQIIHCPDGTYSSSSDYSIAHSENRNHAGGSNN